MNFFYDLNKKLNSIGAVPESTQLNERDLGKHNSAHTGFDALAKKAEKNPDKLQQGMMEAQAPMYNVRDTKTNKIVGTHSYDTGFRPSSADSGLKSHPTSIPNFHKIDRSVDLRQQDQLKSQQGMSEDQLDELSPATLDSYRSKAIGQASWAGGVAKALGSNKRGRPEDPKYKNSTWTDPNADYGSEGDKYAKLNQKRGAGIQAATKRGATAPGQSYDYIRQGGYGDKTNPAIKGVAEALGTSPDRLLARTGMNDAHKFPRKDQTDLGNIPGMNTPGNSPGTDAYAEKRRGDREKELKPAIKAALGTHGPKG